MVFVTVRTIPILPCRELDDVVPFYQAIGFEVTYRQARPNPYLCLSRSGFDLHFFGVETFEPEKSLGNVLVLVPDTGSVRRVRGRPASGVRKGSGGRDPTNHPAAAQAGDVGRIHRGGPGRQLVADQLVRLRAGG